MTLGRISYEFLGCRNPQCDALESIVIKSEGGDIVISLTQWLRERDDRKIQYVVDESHLFITIE